MKSIFNWIVKLIKSIFGIQQTKYIGGFDPAFEPGTTVITKSHPDGTIEYVQAAEMEDDTPEDPILRLWVDKLLPEMISRGMEVNFDREEGNLVYVSGYSIDGTKNDNGVDRWNDVAIITRYKADSGDALDADNWEILARAIASTSPGWIPTKSGEAAKRGGVAQLKPGQYHAHKIGFHKPSKYGTRHPALVQVLPVTITRDFNADGSPVGDKEYTGVFGINCHSTMPGYDKNTVGQWSEGCLVVRSFKIWLAFIAILKQFKRYKANNDAIFAVTVLNGAAIK